MKESKLEAHLKTHQELETKPKQELQIQQHESQTFVLKPAAIVQGTGVPTDPNLLPTSLQQALSQHQKAVGIPQTLQPTYNYANYQAQQPMRIPHVQVQHQVQQQVTTHQLSAPQEVPLTNEFYQHYAANIANFNHMYKQS